MIYEGKGITLAPFSKRMYESMLKSKCSNYKTWFMNSEVTKYNSHGLCQASDSEFDSFFDSIDKKEIIVFAMMMHRGEREQPLHIGNASLQRIDWVNRSCEFAIIIGETEAWGKGHGSTALEHCLHHAFMVMNMNRVWSGTNAQNLAMNKIFKGMGFNLEGVFRSAQFLSGSYSNINEWAILRDEYDEHCK